MPIKKSQLKKFLVKDLKKIIKDRKIGKITKKTKSQLIGMIQSCDQCKDILSKLNLPIKIKKKPSAKQLAARAKFSAMVKAKKVGKKKVQPKPALEKKGKSELLDIALDKGLKLPETATKEQVLTAIETGKNSLKELHQKDIKVRQTKKVESKRVKTALKEIDTMMKGLIKVEENKIASKKKVEKIGKKAFLDGIFGVNAFNLKREIKDIVNEAKDEQLEVFLSFTKEVKKEVLKKRFDSSKSLGELLNSFIK